MSKAPNKTTLNAIKTYYYNRSRAMQGSIKWDKDADLIAIENTLSDDWHFLAASGTFWFIRYTKTRRVVYTMTEKTFPNFIIQRDRL